MRFANWMRLASVLFIGCAIGCQFEARDTAKCRDVIFGMPIETTVNVHRCHDPMAMTFHVYVKDPPVRWQHTFVTSNRDEKQEIAGFDRKMALHVQTSINGSQQILVQADYHIDGICGRLFLDTIVQLDDSLLNSCITSTQASPLGGHIVVGVVAALVVSLLAASITYLHRKRRSGNLDRLALMNNVEVGLPGASPYQEGATVSGNSSKVEYHNGKGTTDIIIRNGFVDSTPKEGTFYAQSI